MSGITDGDTIAAIATAAGRSGIGIIRISGDLAEAIGSSICGKILQPRHATLSPFTVQIEGSPVQLDNGIALLFNPPKSFTGETIVELQAHGGPVILDALLSECCRLGARIARPGEFSERAFLNGRMDLSQAEAIADLINAGSVAAARNAMRTLSGEFSRHISRIVHLLTQLRVHVESAIDFPEEEVDFLSDDKICIQLEHIYSAIQDLINNASQGALLREGLHIVIAGRPNAGKSSLMNLMSGQDTAIVTPTAGTTRDVLKEQILLDDVPLHLVDTAGIRFTDDQIEREGVRRALSEIERADMVILMVDITASDEESATSIRAELPDNLPLTVVYNKCDLLDNIPQNDLEGDPSVIHISAHTGYGYEDLKHHILRSVGYNNHPESDFSARRRHLDALHRSLELLDSARGQLELGAGELMAEDLRLCQEALGEITGEVTADDLLGEIFSSFCIGK